MLSRFNIQLRSLAVFSSSSLFQSKLSFTSEQQQQQQPSEPQICTAFDLARYRSLIRVKGQDSAKYVQNLITNNVYNLNSDRVLYSMILNNRGRIMYDVLVYANESINKQEFLIEFDSDYANEFMKFLNVYKIRKKVEISQVDEEFKLFALINARQENLTNTNLTGTYLCSPDPRTPLLGHRLIISNPNSDIDLKDYCDAPRITSNLNDYKINLYKNGVAENHLDISYSNSIPLEYNVALMNGVSFSKGCYLGQELIAKTHHTGVIRKRVLPIRLKQRTERTFPKDAAILNVKTGKQAGKLINILDTHGIGMLRLAELEKDQLALVDSLNENHLIDFHVPDYWRADENLIRLMKEKNLF